MNYKALPKYLNHKHPLRETRALAQSLIDTRSSANSQQDHGPGMDVARLYTARTALSMRTWQQNGIVQRT